MKLEPNELDTLLRLNDNRIARARHDHDALEKKSKLPAGRNLNDIVITRLGTIREKHVAGDGSLELLTAQEAERVGAEGMKNHALGVLRGELARCEPAARAGMRLAILLVCTLASRPGAGVAGRKQGRRPGESVQ